MGLTRLASTGYSAKVSTTRPANTTPAYDANDVVGATAAAWTFPDVGPSDAWQNDLLGANIMITSASLRVNLTAVPATMTSFRLYLYNVTPPSALADKAAFDLPDGDRSGFLGYIDLGTPIDIGSTLYVQTDGINKQVTLAAGSSTLYGYLVTNGTYTPTSGEVYAIELNTAAM